MKLLIPDIAKVARWSYMKFLLFSFVILLFYDVTFLLTLPVLQQFIGFLVLTFIPGFCLARILKIDYECRVTNILIIIGLSLSFIYILGLLINLSLLKVGIKPMSPFVLFTILNVSILTMLTLSPKGGFDIPKMEINITPTTLFLLLLPFLSIFGAFQATYFHSVTLVICFLFFVSLIPLLIAMNKIPENLYPLLIFAVSLSILYHVNLISTHLWSFDIFFESYSTRVVLNTGVWDPNLDYKTHSLLLLTVLAPMYAIICDLSYVWVFKIVFPFLFSFVPLALYKLYQNFEIGGYKLDKTLALFSVFTFVFFYGFFKNLPDKQYIAELFLILILLVVGMKETRNLILLILFSFSLVVTHYGVSYLFMLSLILLFLMSYYLKSKNIFTLNYLILFVTLTLGWYMFVALGNKYEMVVSIGNHIVKELAKLSIPAERTGISYALYEVDTFLWNIYKLIHIMLQIFIIIGFILLLHNFYKRKPKELNIIHLSIPFYILLSLQIVLTYGMGFDRILQITLTLLSPIALFGFIYIFKFKKNVDIEKIKVLFALYLFIFFLFNSGLVFKLCNDRVPSYSIALDIDAGWPVYNESEVNCMLWLKSHESQEYYVAAFNIWSIIKSRDGLLLSEFYPENEIVRLTPDRERLVSGTYIFFGKTSIGKVKLTGLREIGGYINITETAFYSNVLLKSHKIYTCKISNLYVHE